MADQFGKLELPVAATTPAGDPGLQVIADFCKAVINAQAETAWAVLDPRSAEAKYAPTGACRFALLRNPRRRGIKANQLPALFLHRNRSEPVEWTADWHVDNSEATLTFVLPPTQQIERYADRDTFANAFMKPLAAAISLGRHASYVDATDTDPVAPTIAADPDAIKTSIATSLTPQSYSGGDLNGDVGAATMSPRLALTLTTTAAVGAYDPSNPVVFTYTDWLGNTDSTVSLQPTANGGDSLTTTIEAAAVASVDVPAQATTGGAFQFGTAPRAGEGSVLLERSGCERIRLRDWNWTDLEIVVRGAEGQVVETSVYPAIEATLLLREIYTVDRAANFAPLDGADISLVREDDSIITSVEL